MRRWQLVPILPSGAMGEAQDEAVIAPPHLKILRNALIVGPGRIRQVPDWLKADTLKNATPVEGHAVCGIFPFTAQGGVTNPSGGVAFHFNSDDNAIYLHHLDESGLSQRRHTAYASYTEALPPQITGFEAFGRFYFCEYAREATSVRKGLAVYDPAGAGGITIPVFDLVAGGTGAAALRFRGISLHRRTSIIGWGYQNEETGAVDQPHILRYSHYAQFDTAIAGTFVPDTTDETAGFISVGALLVPIVACAPAGQFTIVGKEEEIWSLDGDKSANFYLRQIGQSDGPVSTASMVGTGTLAAWMSLFGPAVSDGQKVERVAIDRDLRRFLSYMDLTTSWACHDASRNRVIWGLRRKEDDAGQVVTSPFLTDLLWWDYRRNEFGVQSLPKQIFSLGTIRGLGQQLVGPTGTVSAITATNISSTGALISWTPGDASPDVTFEVQYRITGAATFISAGKTPPATPSKQLTQLDPVTHYDVRVRQIRNAQFSAFTTSTDLFTTLTTPPVPDPANPTVEETGVTAIVKGKITSQVVAKWTPFIAANTVVRLYRRSNATTPGPVDPPQGEAGSGAGTKGILDPSFQTQGHNVYYWLRTEATDGSGKAGEFVPCTPFPIPIIGFV